MFSFPKMPRFSKFFENAFKYADLQFDEMDKDFEETSKKMDEVFENLNKEFYTLDKVKAGEEHETVREERKPDGTVIITRTIVRKSG
jgi:hypothetical protein